MRRVSYTDFARCSTSEVYSLGQRVRFGYGMSSSVGHLMKASRILSRIWVIAARLGLVRRRSRYALWARATNVVKGNRLRNSLHVYDQRKRSPTALTCHRTPASSSSRRRPERNSPSTLLWCPTSRRRLTPRREDEWVEGRPSADNYEKKLN